MQIFTLYCSYLSITFHFQGIFFLNMMLNISGERRGRVISNISMQWENNFLFVSRHDVDFSQMPSLHALRGRQKNSREGGVYLISSTCAEQPHSVALDKPGRRLLGKWCNLMYTSLWAELRYWTSNPFTA